MIAVILAIFFASVAFSGCNDHWDCSNGRCEYGSCVTYGRDEVGPKKCICERFAQGAVQGTPMCKFGPNCALKSAMKNKRCPRPEQECKLDASCAHRNCAMDSSAMPGSAMCDYPEEGTCSKMPEGATRCKPKYEGGPVGTKCFHVPVAARFEATSKVNLMKIAVVASIVSAIFVAVGFYKKSVAGTGEEYVPVMAA